MFHFVLLSTFVSVGLKSAPELSVSSVTDTPLCQQMTVIEAREDESLIDLGHFDISQYKHILFSVHLSLSI